MSAGSVAVDAAVNQALVLAAGNGDRFRNPARESKLLQSVLGRPLIIRTIETARAAGIRRFEIVLGYQADRLRAAIERQAPSDVVLHFTLQPGLGTGKRRVRTRRASPPPLALCAADGRPPVRGARAPAVAAGACPPGRVCPRRRLAADRARDCRRSHQGVRSWRPYRRDRQDTDHLRRARHGPVRLLAVALWCPRDVARRRGHNAERRDQDSGRPRADACVRHWRCELARHRHRRGSAQRRVAVRRPGPVETAVAS